MRHNLQVGISPNFLEDTLYICTSETAFSIYLFLRAIG